MAKKKETKYQDKKNWFEWSVFGVGLVLVLGILGYLVYKTATHVSGPPDLFVEYSPEPGTYEPYRYHVTLHNKGHETAEAIVVELSLVSAGEEPEKTELSFAYCPKESTQEGWVSFSRLPIKSDTIQVRIVSYGKP